MFRHGPEGHEEDQDGYEVSSKVQEAKAEGKYAAEYNRNEWRWFIPVGSGMESRGVLVGSGVVLVSAGSAAGNILKERLLETYPIAKVCAKVGNVFAGHIHS